MRILDCTLRDGGYVNNWEFKKESFDKIITNLSDIGVDTIEVGIFGGGGYKDGFTTSFQRLDEIPHIENKTSVNLAMMGTVQTLRDMNLIEAKDSSINTIRLAYFKEDFKEALSIGERLRKYGYRCFMQAMATFMYTDKELLEMIKEINNLGAYAFYIVDSFGLMYPDDLLDMYNKIKSSLSEDIKIGFHAHNNLQLAFANAIKFIEIARDCDYIDASLYGMGRGAGNLPIELILKYLNDKKGCKYKLDTCLSTIEECILEEIEKNKWGYELSYYYTALYETNVVYLWYLGTKGIRDERIVRDIIRRIPKEDRHTLNKKMVDELIKEYGNNRENS